MSINNVSQVRGTGQPPEQSAGRVSPPPGKAEDVRNARQTQALLPSELSPVTSKANVPEEGLEAPPRFPPIEEVEKQSSQVNEYLHQAGTHLEFRVAEQTGRVVIRVVNTDTDETIRTIPPEVMERFAGQVSQMRGILLNKAG